MLSRKNHLTIARIIKKEYTRYDNTGIDNQETKFALIALKARLADYFIIDNPRFNRAKFMRVCITR